MELRKKSGDSCDVISEKPTADEMAEKNADVVATTINSRLNSEEPERRADVIIRKVTAPNIARTMADPAARPLAPVSGPAEAHKAGAGANAVKIAAARTCARYLSANTALIP